MLMLLLLIYFHFSDCAKLFVPSPKPRAALTTQNKMNIYTHAPTPRTSSRMADNIITFYYICALKWWELLPQRHSVKRKSTPNTFIIIHHYIAAILFFSNSRNNNSLAVFVRWLLYICTPHISAKYTRTHVDLVAKWKANQQKKKIERVKKWKNKNVGEKKITHIITIQARMGIYTQHNVLWAYIFFSAPFIPA